MQQGNLTLGDETETDAFDADNQSMNSFPIVNLR